MANSATAEVIGQRIKKRRESVPWIDEDGELREGMSQRELARRVLVSQPSIHQWETGQTIPVHHHQWRLATALRLDHADLFGPVEDVAEENPMTQEDDR
jgi:transcriptional regulator with XRE-family HTH domain